FSRTRIDRGAAPNLINPADVGVKFTPLVKNFIDITLTGDFRLGCGTCAPGFFNDNSYQVANDVDYVRGKHQITFGGTYFKNQLNWLATRSPTVSSCSVANSPAIRWQIFCWDGFPRSAEAVRWPFRFDRTFSASMYKTHGTRRRTS